MTLTADIVSAHVSYNSVATDALPQLIASVHAALADAALTPEPSQQVDQKPAVSIRRSVRADHLVCLEDGKKMKMLKRHLMTYHGMTPADYRAKWNLPSDYPMAAPEYSERRRAQAKKAGLGRNKQERTAPPAATPDCPAPKARRKLRIKI